MAGYLVVAAGYTHDVNIITSARKIILPALCLFILLGIRSAHAASTLIVIPTARTLQDGTYYVAAQEQGSLLNTQEKPVWTAKTKFGFKQSEAGANVDRDKNGNVHLRFNAKYSFPLDPHAITAVALGFQALGVNSIWTPYSVVSHRIEKADLHFGIFETQSDDLGWFTGVDYLIKPCLDLMADYTSGDNIEWSSGFEYKFNQQWKVKAGARVRTDKTEPVIEVKYTRCWR